MQIAIPTALGALALAFAAPAAGPARLAVDPDQVLLSYQAALGAVQLAGTSRALSARVVELPGAVRVTARVPVASFESGNAALDAVFRRALDQGRFPFIELEGTAALAGRGTSTVQLASTLTLHGVSLPLTVPVQLSRHGKAVLVQARFALDLSRFGVAAPLIDGLRAGSRVQIELVALLQPEQPAALAALPEG